MEGSRCFLGGLALGLASFGHCGSSDFGTSGLIKMPDARMQADGTLSATLALDELAAISNVTFQALPKVQATFRYAVFDPTRNRQDALDKERDRSYGIKIQIAKEDSWRPALALGFRDLLGTGVVEGEYAVASKSFGQFDATIGIGWGRLGTRSGFSNPLGVISDSLDVRPSGAGGTLGGKARGDTFFRGNAALFGGASYRFASVPIEILAEYDSDDYGREVSLGTVPWSPSAWNVGVAWEPLTGLNIRASWLRGDTLGITFSTQVATKTMSVKKEVKRPLPKNLDSRTGLPTGYDPSSWYDRMVFAAEQTGILLREASWQAPESRASLVIENLDYNLTADAVGQAVKLGERLLPASVTNLDVLLVEEGLRGPTVNYSLQSLAEATKLPASAKVHDDLKILEPRSLKQPTNRTEYGYPSWAFGVDLAAKVQLMDPNDPGRKQVYAKLTGRLQLSGHTNLWMRYEQNLYNDFTASRPPNSRLPNVRTQVARYLVDGESGIEQLYAEHKRSVGASIHARMYAGILEAMYGGVGGELLYAPYMQRWALGVNINAVKQRGFERNFRFRDYETVTGHVSAYYATPFYDVDLAVHVGRYLAKDQGYTFEARRTFDSGFSLGGFFTRTDVSAADFGEGSFDKGLFFRIPFDGFLPWNTRTAYSTILRPLERDGGRRLENFGGSLWFDRRSLRYDALDRNRARMVSR